MEKMRVYCQGNGQGNGRGRIVIQKMTRLEQVVHKVEAVAKEREEAVEEVNKEEGIEERAEEGDVEKEAAEERVVEEAVEKAKRRLKRGKA